MKTERESELIIEQVLIAMSTMGLDRERTLQVRAYTVANLHDDIGVFSRNGYR